jgi:inositol-pentakisphosphate 2-kinase
MIPMLAIAAVVVGLTVLLLLRLRRRPKRDVAPPTLPADSELSYMAEGAANIIYRVSDNTRLLRLRKTLPSAQPNFSAYEYLSSTAFPLFPRHLLVDTTLIRLPPGLVERENARLRTLESTGKRTKKRVGMYLETSENYAFMIADMTPHSPRQVLVEFKPKWVIQSPSAPRNAKRCRTCALRAKKSGGTGFCPIDLASGDARRVRRAVAHIVPKQPPTGFAMRADWEQELEVLQERVVEFLLTSELMPVLSGLQRKLDPEGPLGSMGEGFTDAMTVRDLTVFLRVDMDGGVECGIGDLDLKTKEGGKENYWRNTERKLIEEGWYEGEEGSCEL